MERAFYGVFLIIRTLGYYQSNERINVVKYNQAPVQLCLANVYIPARGSSEDEEGFGECLDMLHDVILKYNSSHTVIIGGDFNSSNAQR